MKKITYFIRKNMLPLCLLVFPLLGFSQHFEVTLDNMVMTTNTFEVDVMLVVPASGVRLASVSTGINYNPAILNGGTPCITSSNSGCDSWALMPDSIAPEIIANGGLNVIVTMNRGTSAGYFGHLRIVQTTKVPSQVDIPGGTYRVGRFKFTNTVPWAVDSDPELWLSPTNSNPYPGSSNTIVGFAPYGSTVTPVHATTNTSPYDVTLGYTQASPMHRVLNSSLATVSSASVSEIVTAYPNPFQDIFKLNMNAVSTENVQIKVYDMLGKLVDAINVEANAVNDFAIGQNYASGLYNIKISQGDKTQSIRIIKQ